MRRCLMLVAVFFTPAFAGAQDKPLSRIAFGSRAPQEREIPIWEKIAACKPDLFLSCGDYFYGHSMDMKVLKAQYDTLAAMPGYQRLKASCPILATWRDSDFRVNDGKDYPMRKQARQVFLDFHGVPKESPLRTRKGIYRAEMFGPVDRRVQVILLDICPFSDESKKRTLLGQAQWKWLEAELKKPAKLRLVVSSISVVAEDHDRQKWMNIPAERDRLFDLICETKANGIVFLSGGGLAELSMMDDGVGYPLFDLTSSVLNRAPPGWRPLEKNAHRVAAMPSGNNFGVVEIDWVAKPPLVRLQIRDEAGDIAIQHKAPLSLLTIGTIPASGWPQVKLAGGELLTRDRAAKNLAKQGTVSFRVRATGESKTDDCVLLHSARRCTADNEFTIVVTKQAREQFRNFGIYDVRARFTGKSVAVTGVLDTYQSRPAIRVQDAWQIKLAPQ